MWWGGLGPLSGKAVSSIKIKIFHIFGMPKIPSSSFLQPVAFVGVAGPVWNLAPNWANPGTTLTVSYFGLVAFLLRLVKKIKEHHCTFIYNLLLTTFIGRFTKPYVC